MRAKNNTPITSFAPICCVCLQGLLFTEHFGRGFRTWLFHWCAFEAIHDYHTNAFPYYIHLDGPIELDYGVTQPYGKMEELGGGGGEGG